MIIEGKKLICSKCDAMCGNGEFEVDIKDTIFPVSDIYNWYNIPGYIHKKQFLLYFNKRLVKVKKFNMCKDLNKDG